MVDLSDVENILASNFETYLSTMVGGNFNRIELIVYKPLITTHTEVYGTESGEEGIVEAGKITALLAGDTFFSSDAHSAGTISEGWIFTTSNLIDDGAVVDVVRNDQRARRYKVTDTQKIGSTRAVFRKFRLASIAD